MPVFIIALLITISASAGVTASHDALPGEALYSVKQAVEAVQIAAARTPGDKASVHVRVLDARVKEVEQMKQKDAKPDEMAKAVEAVAKQQATVDGELTLVTEGKDVEAIVARLQANLERQQAVLDRVLDQVPDSAKVAIERAQERSRHGLERAIERQLTNPAAGVSIATDAAAALQITSEPQQDQGVGAERRAGINAGAQAQGRGALVVR